MLFCFIFFVFFDLVFFCFFFVFFGFCVIFYFSLPGRVLNELSDEDLKQYACNELLPRKEQWQKAVESVRRRNVI